MILQKLLNLLIVYKIHTDQQINSFDFCNSKKVFSDTNVSPLSTGREGKGVSHLEGDLKFNA